MRHQLRTGWVGLVFQGPHALGQVTVEEVVGVAVGDGDALAMQVDHHRLLAVEAELRSDLPEPLPDRLLHFWQVQLQVVVAGAYGDLRARVQRSSQGFHEGLRLRAVQDAVHAFGCCGQVQRLLEHQQVEAVAVEDKMMARSRIRTDGLHQHRSPGVEVVVRLNPRRRSQVQIGEHDQLVHAGSLPPA